MSIEFIPLGTLVSTSLAISSSMALTVTVEPVTAAFAEHALNLIGPTGDTAIITQSRALRSA